MAVTSQRISLDDFLYGRGSMDLKPSELYERSYGKVATPGDSEGVGSYSPFLDYTTLVKPELSGRITMADSGFRDWVKTKALAGRTPQDYIQSINSGLGVTNPANQGGFSLNPDGTVTAYTDESGGFLDNFMNSPAAPIALFGGFMGAAGAAGAAGAGAGAADGAGWATASNAIDAPVFGAGATGATAGATMPYGDAIEGLIDLTNKGLTGEQAIQTLGEINPSWIQSGAEFLMNNPSEILSAVKGIPGGSSILSRLLGGQGTSSDWASTIGKLLATGLGAYGSNQQASAYKELADKYMGFGAPYRDRLAALYADPSSFLSSPEVRVPVDQATKSLAQALSVQGNPFDSPNAKTEIEGFAADKLFSRLGQEKDRLAGFGGLSAYSGAAPSLETAAIGSNKSLYDALGYGVNNIFNPQPTLTDLLKELKGLRA